MIPRVPLLPASSRANPRLLVVSPSTASKGLKLDAPQLRVPRPLPFLLVNVDGNSRADLQHGGQDVPRRGSVCAAFLKFLATSTSRNPEEADIKKAASSIWKPHHKPCSSLWLPHSSCKAWVCTTAPHLVLALPWGEVETCKESILNLARLFRIHPASVLAVSSCTRLSPGQFSIIEGDGEEGSASLVLSGLDRALGSASYLTLRLGLGKPRERALLEKFKQEPFSEKEARLLERKTFPEAGEIIHRVLVGDNFASRDKVRFRCDFPLQEGKPKRTDAKAGRGKTNFLNRLQRHLK